MRICIINASPRGKNSVTVHTALYLQKRYPAHTFDIVTAGTRVNALEKDPAPVIEAMLAADLVLFSYPVYTFIAPSQLHRLIAAIKRSGANLRGKYVSQITTSKHFYDVTAHRYVEDNCHDLGMHVIHGLSADMDDLTIEKGQKEADAFFEYALYCVEHGIHEPAPAKIAPAKPYLGALTPIEKKEGFDTVIVTDLRAGDDDLKAMIADFSAAYPYPVRTVNIAEYPFKGGCLGCFHCASDGTCVYKDGFDSFLRNEIQTADAIVYAFTIRDHSMGATFKIYDDRQFCNGHRTVTEGMPFAYIVNGNYEAESNLRTIIEARADVGGNFLAGVGYDEQSLKTTVDRLVYALEHHYAPPRTFYGVGGMRIFRDLIWIMRGLMKADHAFYKKHGVYDFPQKQWKRMLLMCLVGKMMRSPKLKDKMGNKMNEGMVAPYQKVLNQTQPKQ